MVISYWNKILSKTMKVTHLDHIVLTVKDIDASCAFYTDLLGNRKHEKDANYFIRKIKFQFQDTSKLR